MTETWVANLEAKARIVHGQLNAALRLSEKHGDSTDLTSETYLEMIREIYQQEFALAELMDAADLLICYEGNPDTCEAPDMELLGNKLTAIGQSLKQLARSVVGLHEGAELVRQFDFDPRLAGVSKDGLLVGVQVPPCPEAAQIRQFVYDAVCGLARVADHIEGAAVTDGMLAEFPDPAMRQAVLTAALSLAPQQPGDLEVTLITSVHETTHPRALTLAGHTALESFLQAQPEQLQPERQAEPQIEPALA